MADQVWIVRVGELNYGYSIVGVFDSPKGAKETVEILIKEEDYSDEEFTPGDSTWTWWKHRKDKPESPIDYVQMKMYWLNRQFLYPWIGVKTVEMMEDFVCSCGNHSHAQGFHPCNFHGVPMEPEEGWNNHWRCDRCERVYYDKGR